MALSQSVASELMESLCAGEGVDLIREPVRLVMQELIETEATGRIGAGRYERTDTRVTDRNGSWPSASSAPSSPTSTTNGRSPIAATSPRPPWPNSARPATLNTSPQSKPATDIENPSKPHLSAGLNRCWRFTSASVGETPRPKVPA